MQFITEAFLLATVQVVDNRRNLVSYSSYLLLMSGVVVWDFLSACYRYSFFSSLVGGRGTNAVKRLDAQVEFSLCCFFELLLLLLLLLPI